MADAGIFVGWGPPVSGREESGLGVFTGAMEYWRGLQVEAAIESFEVALLEPHGGDLYGFALVRGTEQQLNELRLREDFQALITRAGLIVERLGVVSVALGEGIGRQIGLYQEAIRELAS